MIVGSLLCGTLEQGVASCFRRSNQFVAPTASCGGCRSFAAYGTNWKHAPKKRRRGSLSNRTKDVGVLASMQRDTDSSVVPPAELLPTASRNVYVSRYYAIQQHKQNTNWNPLQLFQTERLSHNQRPHCRYHGTHPPPITNGSTMQALSEIAVLGRSNVGKSSLLNALTGQNLQRVSKQPGRTQHPHYLECSDNNGESIIGYLVDLPGYGFAIGPEEAVDAWQQRTQQILLRRRDVGALQRIYLLVDGRHGVTSLDLSIMGWLEEGEFPFTVVLTKCDAVSRPLTVKYVNQLCMRYHHESTTWVSAAETDIMMSPLVHITSSKTGSGLLEVWASVLRDFKGNHP